MSNPRYPTALAHSYAAYDADRAAGHALPTDRDGYARAYAQIATALPEGWSPRAATGFRPRHLAPVHSALVLTPEQMTDAVHAIAGGR